ncbi:hypothetical protein BGZ70_008145 [Mortierella alpina]|uniref:Arrestin C-terminal-like domain-containing protein n=1 Tax=Mortierella alpina TaxID=64518 RepID=A0A9P6J498_MORAP|nr:hypothetical protein BGZ70_008145 [Mortierella alpina]
MPEHAPANSDAVRQSSDSAAAQGQTLAGGAQQHCLFEINNLLLLDEPLRVKRHAFMFNIKFPRVNLPASMVDGERSVVYSLHAELDFLTNPDDALTQATLVSPAVQLKYLPLVPTCIPHFPVIEMAQVMDPYSNRVLFKAAVESPQRGLCPGESLPLSLSLTNSSETELQVIHLSLIRVISYPTSESSSPSTSSPSANALLSTDPVTVYSTTIPVSKTPNKNSTWMEALEFKVPSNLGLIPTTNKSITPLYKVDYYLSITLPVASRNTGLASWFTPAVRTPPPIDMSLFQNASGVSSGTGTGTGTTATNASAAGESTGASQTASRAGPRKLSVDKIIKTNLHMDRIATVNATMKWPTLIQLPLVPVIIGTVPYSVTEKQLRWPVPNYLDVMDRPCFVRDRFEEEMMQHLSNLETLIVEEEDEQEIESIVQAATAARKSTSSGESDEEDQRLPERFRNGRSLARRVGSASSGLGTPPPSPPSNSPLVVHPEGRSIGGGAGAGAHTLPRVGRRSMSPKASGLGKELLLEMHHSKIQQTLQSGLQDN